MKAKASIARRIGIGLVAVCATLLTASCAAGKLAATAFETPAIDGTTGHLGQMQLHAVAITAPAGPCVLPGADAALSFVVVNTGRKQDSLQGVSSPRFTSSAAVASAEQLASYEQADPGYGACTQPSGASSTPAPSSTPALPPAAGPQTVQPAQALQLGVYNVGTNPPGVPSEPIILLRGLRGGPLYPGESIPVTFRFARAGQITLQVPVQLSAAPNSAAVPSVTEQATEPVN